MEHISERFRRIVAERNTRMVSKGEDFSSDCNQPNMSSSKLFQSSPVHDDIMTNEENEIFKKSLHIILECCDIMKHRHGPDDCEGHSMSKGVRPVSLATLQTLSESIKAPETPVSVSDGNSDEQPVESGVALFIIIVGDQQSTSFGVPVDVDEVNLDGKSLGEGVLKNSVEVVYIATLDDAMHFIQKTQEEKKECNRKRKQSELKFISAEKLSSLGIDMSSIQDASVNRNMDAHTVDSLGGDSSVKLNRKMRRLLAGKTLTTSLKNISTVESSAANSMDSNNGGECERAKLVASQPTYSSEQHTRYEVNEHFVIILMPSGVSGEKKKSNDDTCIFSGQHDIKFTSLTLSGIPPASHVNHWSTVHVSTMSSISAELSKRCLEVNVNMSLHAGISVSRFESGSKNKKLNRKRHHIALNISDICFRCVEGNIYQKESPITKLSRHNNSFVCGKGSDTTLNIFQCQFEDNMKNSSVPSQLVKKRKKSIDNIPSSSILKNMISGVAGCHVVLSHVNISSKAVVCGVYVNGKSNLSMRHCSLGDIPHGCGVKCDAGASINLRHCVVQKCGMSGVYSRDSLGVILSNCDVKLNNRCGVEIFSCRGNDLSCSPQGGPLITSTGETQCPTSRSDLGVNIHHCSLSGNKSSGILMVNCCSAVITHSSVTQNRLGNVSALSGTTCRVMNCDITGSGRSGIFARDMNTHVELLGGSIHDNNTGNIEAISDATVVEK